MPIEALDRKMTRIAELLSEGPERPLLEQIRRFEESREKIRASVIDHEARLKQPRAIAGITERDVVAIFDNLANDLAMLDAGHDSCVQSSAASSWARQTCTADLASAQGPARRIGF
jgi:nitrate reductase beta subunit